MNPVQFCIQLYISSIRGKEMVKKELFLSIYNNIAKLKACTEEIVLVFYNPFAMH